MKTSNLPTFKMVGWAYPTSPHAVRLGFARAGCYYVATVKDRAVASGRERAIRGFANKADAFAAADALDLPYDRWSMKRP